MIQKKILVLTGIPPCKLNSGGPSGLIWECLQVLEELNIFYKVEVLENKNFFNKLGIFFSKFNKIEDFDFILVYPFNLFFKIDLKIRKKAIVLGPDAPSLLYQRFYKNSNTLKLKIRSYLLKEWFFLKEKTILNNSFRYLVVGKNDKRWLEKIHKKRTFNIFYLTHPILQSIIEDKNQKKTDVNCIKSLVFSGDMSPKYTYNYIYDFFSIIEKFDYHILIVGKNNKWIYKLFSQKVSEENISYKSWVENYADISEPSCHLHIVPLVNGAGTKNRVLSACTLGVTIFSTDIGLENIFYGKPINKIFKFKNVNEILEIINSKEVFYKDNIDTGTYVNRVNERFKKEFIKYIIE